METNMTNRIRQIIFHNVVGHDSEWFWIMVQALAVTVTLIVISRQLKLQRKANVLSSLAALGTRWEHEEMVKCRKNICNAYNAKTDCGIKSTIAVAGFYEEIGLYVKNGMVDAATIWELYGEYIEHYWPILLDRVKEAKSWDKSGFRHFGELHKKCVKLSKKSDPSTAERSPSDLKVFAESELEKS